MSPAPIKLVTKKDREKYHHAMYWIWWVRAMLTLVLAIVLTQVPTYTSFAPIALGATGLSWIWAWVHAQLEVSCDAGKEDCKDDHRLGRGA